MNSRATCSLRPSVLYENRYCGQDEFNIVVCGGKTKEWETREVFKLEGPHFKTSVELSPMISRNFDGSTAVIGSDVYVLSGYNTWLACFERYCSKTNLWTRIVQREDCDLICGFMKHVYVFVSKYCYKYEPTKGKWTKMADMRSKRYCAACTTFEGKIVVAGGCVNYVSLKTVESYDHHENKWSSLSDMVVSKSKHSLLSMGNKMFVISIKYYNCCEVYDSISRKFSLLNLFIPRNGYNYDGYKALNFGKKMFIFYNLKRNDDKLRLHVYDLDELELIDEDVMISKALIYPAVQKYPKS